LFRPDAPQPMSIELTIRTMGNKVVEREPNRPPLRVGFECLAIGLPRPGQGGRPQMNAVLFASAEYVELDAAPGAGIDDATIGREIEGNLNKSAIVFEADVAAYTDGVPAGDYVTDHGPFGDAAHDLVGEELPAVPYLLSVVPGGNRALSPR
jgi:hypothetical protein